MLYRFFRSELGVEWCYYVETLAPLLAQEMKTLCWLLAETFQPERFGTNSFLNPPQRVLEVGPRLNFATAFSTNAVAICQACGLTKVIRLERSRRYLLPSEVDTASFLLNHHDRMTECLYPQPLATFETGLKPNPVRVIPLLEEGIDALRCLNQEMGLGMDEWDLQFYTDLFVNVWRRNPTDVECFQLGQANSEHSRHWFFKGQLIIDGVPVSETLLDIVRSTLQANPSNSLIAFSDNSSAIRGYNIWTIIPQKPGQCSPFTKQQRFYHIIFTAETHNFPSGVAPFPGAETGTGGRIRDVEATGKGGSVGAGSVGYCVGNLNLPDFPIPGETSDLVYPSNLAPPIRILIEESNGASDYGNKFGEPVIIGFVRTGELILPDSERRGWLKPIMFTGGIGQIDDQHIRKDEPVKGMLVVQIGGPAYRIGMGGGAASSMVQGDNLAELDFNAVQRGDAEMEQKMNRVVRACVEMGDNNPIVSIHDQGAGGPCNVLTELVDPSGGRIEIRQIVVGDKTMSVLEIWGAEYQERNALLIWPDRLAEFQAICAREKVNCEVLGEITGNGKIVVHDEDDNSNPVDLDLSRILGKVPQKNFETQRQPRKREPLRLPPDLTLSEAIRLVLRLPSVGSKGYLVHKVDRSVTGLIAQQQCCGPLQLPVSDYAVVAQSHFGLTGAATSIGEQPIKMLVNPAAGARMAVGEALTNLVWVVISDLEDIKCSVNWMWAAKLAGEGAELYDAAVAMRDLMIALGIAADGGKDSLSMAARVGEETVKAPGQMVVSAYCTVPAITRKVTPDIKRPGKSRLMFIDLAAGRNRLGGSALAQAFGQIGSESPDVDNPQLLKQAFLAVQELLKRGWILAGHDRSDGGLITTLIEMALAGNCGLNIELPTDESVIPFLFSEELGLVIEYLPENEKLITFLLESSNIPYLFLGDTTHEHELSISRNNENELCIDTLTLLKWWESTSDRLERFQISETCAEQLEDRPHHRPEPPYHLRFKPEPTLLFTGEKPKVAILREEGSNGDREMTSAFFAAGFEPWDVTMTDLLNGSVDLNQFQGLVFVGGFAHADVLDSAKGWAGIIRFNPRLNEMFERFRDREDIFSLGVCNGCQLMALLGWVPWSGISDTEQPRFIRNPSGKFESRWVTVRILESPAIMLQGMTGSTLGIWVAHGEGRLLCPKPEILDRIRSDDLAPIIYVDDEGCPTEQYPLNPNGSPFGITALCSPDGRHLAMMPHPERSFLSWQWSWLPPGWQNAGYSPWFRMFQNAFQNAQGGGAKPNDN